MEPITSFRGKYHFLSNFYPHPITYKGILFPSTEHAYQAMKSSEIMDWFDMAAIKKEGDSKRQGKILEQRPGFNRDHWNSIRRYVMYDVLTIKFQDPTLRIWLLETGDAELVEGNTWRDNYWGVYLGKGQNWLGKILMLVRKEILLQLKKESYGI